MTTEIGRASKVDFFEEEIEKKEGVSFTVPYDENPYNILLTNEELDSILKSGVEALLANRAFKVLAFKIPLLQPDLPLLSGMRSAEIDPDQSSSRLNMRINIVTLSEMYEHRGVLYASRDYEGRWELERYKIQPPLEELEKAS